MGREDGQGLERSGGGAESWLRLSEGLVAGVHHALNNRMAALRGVGQVMEADLPPNHPLAGALVTELQRLEETASLLALLGLREEGLVPFQVESVVGEATKLFEMHHALRDRRLVTQVSDGLFPVLANPGDLLRGILLMLASTAGEMAGEIRLSATGDERTIRITVTTSDQHGSEALDDPELQPLPLAAIQRIVEKAGATVSRDGGAGGGIALTLLTLPEARKRQF